MYTAVYYNVDYIVGSNNNNHDNYLEIPILIITIIIIVWTPLLLTLGASLTGGSSWRITSRFTKGLRFIYLNVIKHILYVML